MLVEAKHGLVVIDLGNGNQKHLSREAAADLLVSIASAIHHAGDISEPSAVWMHEEVARAVHHFKVKDRP